MEPAAASCFDAKALIGIIGEIRLCLPEIESSPGYRIGEIRLAQVQHRLPDKPLMSHPDIPIPISVIEIVGGAHVHGGDTARTPHLLRIFQMG